MISTDQEQLDAIEAQLAQRFPQRNVLSEAIHKKVALCIYKKERCAELLVRARRAMRTPSWGQASIERRAEFQDNVKQTQERITELNRLIRNYLSALQEAERFLQPQ